MRYLFIPFFASLLLVCSHTNAESERLVVSTELWPPNFTKDTGDGLYQELVNTVFSQHQVQYIYANYPRSKHLVKSQQADFWLGSYRYEEEFALFPSEAMDQDTICVVMRSQDLKTWRGMSNLKNEAVIWLNDYHYDKYYPDLSMQPYEVADIQTALSLVTSGRLDYFINDYWDTMAYLDEHPEELTRIHLQMVDALYLYPAFANTPANEKLIEHWDNTMRELKRNGKLEKLFKKHAIPFPYFE